MVTIGEEIWTVKLTARSVRTAHDALVLFIPPQIYFSDEFSGGILLGE